MRSPEVQVDFTIIGAGIIGLFIAKSLIEKFPQAEICVLDQAKYLGDATSGRNSGVLHAGIYYAHNSLKHRLCLEGNAMWNEIADELNVPYSRCGKWIVAKSADENEALEKVFQQAKQNEVPEIRHASTAEVHKLNDIVWASTALFSPRTGIIDQSSALLSLRTWLENKGVTILLQTKVMELTKAGADRWHIQAGESLVETGVAINCAGLEAIALRKQLGLTDFSDYWVKGSYLKTTQNSVAKELIYPIPHKDLKGLGVHLTLDMAGGMKFGPDTQDTDSLSYEISDRARDLMLPSVQAFFRTVDSERLRVDYCGIRPKVKNAAGEVMKDFIIQSPLKNYWEFLGIESPGFTAAPAIAKYFAAQI